MRLIVWLWNPWKEYEKTRHNIWFLVLNKIISDYNIVLSKKYKWLFWKSIINWNNVFFLKPLTYMNKSWESVIQVTNFFKIKPENILIIHDDIDLPLSKIKFKYWWSHAWHNWLKDIINKIWTKDFYRIRIWIDRPIDKNNIINYVLSNFKKEELNNIYEKLDEIKTYITKFLIN